VTLSIITAPLPAILHDQVFKGTLSTVPGGAVEQLVTGYRWAFGFMVTISLLTIAACTARSKAT
jgi:hypothetical protein